MKPKIPHTITTLSFDGDMTLWDFQKVIRHALSITLEELRRRIPGTLTAALGIDRMIEIQNQVLVN